jgi:molybdopterin converting factor small subunit
LITVRLLGHIKTSVGASEVDLPDDSLEASAIVDRLRSMSKEDDPGFSMFNTVAMIEDGEAFVPAASDRVVKSGERVVLIPFSHGG